MLSFSILPILMATCDKQNNHVNQVDNCQFVMTTLFLLLVPNKGRVYMNNLLIENMLIYV